MNSVIRLHRRARKTTDPRMVLPDESEEQAARQLAAYALAFTGCALAMYTAAVLAVWDSWSETLSILWLVFVVAFSKLLIANGLLVMVLRADRKQLADLAAQEESARRLTRWRANIRLRRAWRDSKSAGQRGLRLVERNPSAPGAPEE